MLSKRVEMDMALRSESNKAIFENLKDLDALRENANFNKKLARMMTKLSNNRSKDSKNTKIYKILIKAGKDIYNELN